MIEGAKAESGQHASVPEEGSKAKFKEGTPGFSFQDPEVKGKFQQAIQERTNTDKADMKSCIEGGHIETLRDSPKTTKACEELRSATRELFTDGEALKPNGTLLKAQSLGYHAGLIMKE